MPGSKLAHYLLNVDHPKGGPKARFFLAFGFDPARPEVMAEALILHATDARCVPRPAESGPYRRMIVEGPMETPDGRRPRVRSDHVLMLVDQGGVRIDLPRSGQSCGAGQLVFVPAGSAFAVQPAADAQGAVLRIPSALTRDLTPALPTQLLAGHFSADLRAELGAHLSAIQRDGGLPVASARQAADARLRLLSILLQRADLFSQPQDKRTSVTPLQNGSKRIMRDFIDLAGRELGRGRTLSDLAQAIGVNRVDLDAACQAQRGQTALEMLYDLRFEGAMALLRGTHDSLGSIATRMGYTGVAHLNRAFVAATGRPAESFRAPGRA